MSEIISPTKKLIKRKGLEPEELIGLMKEAERLRSKQEELLDENGIVKPSSGDLVQDIIETIQKHVIPHLSNLKIRCEYPLKGVSGKIWRSDIILEDITEKNPMNKVKVIIECKQVGKMTSAQTYSTSHIPRAYMELSDLKNWKDPLKFAIFSNRFDKGKHSYDDLFQSIDTKIIDYSHKTEWFLDFVFKIVNNFSKR